MDQANQAADLTNHSSAFQTVAVSRLVKQSSTYGKRGNLASNGHSFFTDSLRPRVVGRTKNETACLGDAGAKTLLNMSTMVDYRQREYCTHASISGSCFPGSYASGPRAKQQGLLPSPGAGCSPGSCIRPPLRLRTWCPSVSRRAQSACAHRPCAILARPIGIHCLRCCPRAPTSSRGRYLARKQYRSRRGVRARVLQCAAV
jgi:hypothetical protein